MLIAYVKVIVYCTVFELFYCSTESGLWWTWCCSIYRCINIF